MNLLHALFFAGIVYATTTSTTAAPTHLVLLGEEPQTIEYPVIHNEALIAPSQSQEPISTSTLFAQYFGDRAPTFLEIARCESTMRQFNDNGSVLRGRAVREDVGILQVNETYHLEEAKRLGFNIYTLEGNVAFSKWLYDRDGLSPWSASRGCWGLSSKLEQ